MLIVHEVRLMVDSGQLAVDSATFENGRRRFRYKRRVKMNVQRQALRRSRNDRILAGVCGGLGEFFGISPFWFRLAMFIAFIPGGVPGILIYILAMMIIPSE
jgi:phage shock protein C